ncbi:MAG: hypothetical protein AB1689_16210 [Thermodesulfobacteriota bacterium]
MEIKDLDHDEQLALVALVEFIGESNREITDEELERISRVAAALGPATYRRLAEEVDGRFEDEKALRRFLSGVGRSEARELVYATALEVAMGDTIQKSESDLLDWLAKAWHVDVRIEGSSGS